MNEIRKPQYITDIIDDFGYYSNCMKDTADKTEIPRLLKEHIKELCSDSHISAELLEGFACRSIDRLYRRLMQITSFDQFMKAYFELVISELWKSLLERGIRMFYVLDNSLREDKFKLTCEAFSLTGISVVTPYARNVRDGTGGLFETFDTERMREKKPSTAFLVNEHIIAPMGYRSGGHYLSFKEVETLIANYMRAGNMLAYIEKDNSVNYLENVLHVGKPLDYVQIFRNKAFDDGEFRVSSKNIKEKFIFIIDAKAP